MDRRQNNGSVKAVPPRHYNKKQKTKHRFVPILTLTDLVGLVIMSMQKLLRKEASKEDVNEDIPSTAN